MALEFVYRNGAKIKTTPWTTEVCATRSFLRKFYCLCVVSLNVPRYTNFGLFKFFPPPPPHISPVFVTSPAHNPLPPHSCHRNWRQKQKANTEQSKRRRKKCQWMANFWERRSIHNQQMSNKHTQIQRVSKERKSTCVYFMKSSRRRRKKKAS